MYAVIKTGGKQYKVTEGQLLKVETLVADIGATVGFPALMIANGADVQCDPAQVANSKVQATVVQHGRGEKIKIIKMRRRKHSRKQMGHRQNFTEVQITHIS
jgi:large subunit ribosomal protein L21